MGLQTPIVPPGSKGKGEFAKAGTKVANVSIGATSEIPTLEATTPSEVDKEAGQVLSGTSVASVPDVAKGVDPITPRKRPQLDAKEQRAQKSSKKSGQEKGQDREKTTPHIEQKTLRIGADTLAGSVRLQQI